jgi:rod shape-determining protein MreD
MSGGELFLTGPARLLAALLPFGVAVIFMVISNLPVSFTGGVLPAPVLVLAAIYFWGVNRRDLMPPMLVVALGLLEDLLSGGPPGLWTAGFVAAYAAIDRQRDSLMGLTDAGAVIGFFGIMVIAAGGAYGLAALVYLRLPPVAPLLVESVITVLFYPLLAIPMTWMQKHLIGASRSAMLE